jgi:hypothetical protein
VCSSEWCNTIVLWQCHRYCCYMTRTPAWSAGTSRKYFRGPRGIGFLYARNSTMAAAAAAVPGSSSSSMAGWEPALIDIHGAQWTGPDSCAFYDGAVRYEQYEANMAAKVIHCSGMWCIYMCMCMSVQMLRLVQGTRMNLGTRLRVCGVAVMIKPACSQTPRDLLPQTRTVCARYSEHLLTTSCYMLLPAAGGLWCSSAVLPPTGHHPLLAAHTAARSTAAADAVAMRAWPHDSRQRRAAVWHCELHAEFAP